MALVVLDAAALTTDDGLCFSVNSDGTATVVAGDYATLCEAIIPEDVNGHTVIAIADSAFIGCTSLKSVSIPATVTAVGSDAFARCSLESLTTYASLDAAEAFTSCSVHDLYVGSDVAVLNGLAIAPAMVHSFADVPPCCDDATFTSYSGALHVTRRGFTDYFVADHWSRFSIIADDAGDQPTSLAVSSEAATVDVGGTLALTATLAPAGVLPVTWRSTDASVATVSSTGVVTARAAGTATITATCMGLRATCRVTVNDHPITVTVSKHLLTLRRNGTATLTATTEPVTAALEWRTTDPTVALLRVANGEATVAGNRPGRAMIIAYTAGDATQADTCRVTVARPNGDATCDGFTDVEDLNAIINVMLGKYSSPAVDDLPYYDLNDDAQIDVDDMNHIINVMLDITARSTTYAVNGVSFKMVAVEGGTFTMGATAEQGDDYMGDERPTHQVKLSDYNIGQTEVTQELWLAVMGSNPSYFNQYGNCDYDSFHSTYDYGTNLQRPVECVSWNDCQEFIARLNEITGVAFRLPTEAEWEFAARGGNKSNGYKYSGSNNIDDVAWFYLSIPTLYRDEVYFGTQTVATKAPNELGIYDMSGNAWEWCQDWYDDSYYANSPLTNPMGPNLRWDGGERVMRGGGYLFEARECRVASRESRVPFSRGGNYGCGLRLAL